MPPKERDPVKVRNSYKGQLTTFTAYLNALESSESLSAADVSELQLRLGKIEALYSRYDEVQLILECDETEDLASQLKDRSDFESSYYKSLAKANLLLKEYHKGEDSRSSSNNSSPQHNMVKLPTIQLPKFSGSYENWLEFHDTFSSLIHENHDIDNINKFHYLRTSLEGSAAIVIKAIEFSANNYQIAWDLLCERYDNKRLLVQNHISALFNIEPLTKESSIVLKRLMDLINKNLRALESLGEPVKHWDTLLIYVITQKLDSKTYREWEEFKGRLEANKAIKLESFMSFLRKRADLVETLELSRGNQSPSQTKGNSNKVKTLLSLPPPSKSCPKCNSDHNLSECSQFLSLSNDARLALLPTYKICFNCFGSGHFANHCKKKGCKICKRKHHTLIHVADFKSRSETGGSSEPQSQNRPPTTPPVNPHVPETNNSNVTLTASVLTCSQNNSEILLSTALIKIYDSQNKEHIARAILDSGSTSCLMTEKLYNQLGLPYIKINKSVVGINNVSSEINKMCRVSIQSLDTSFTTKLNCFVLPSITDHVPAHPVDLSDIDIPSQICLADPYFHTPAPVDIILGADIFWDILGNERLVLGDHKPIMFETKLGWIVSGPINANYASNTQTINCNFGKINSYKNDYYSDIDSLHDHLDRFWTLEEVNPHLSHYSKEEKMCESHFVENTTRLENGQFCVKIPLKESPQLLGASLSKATKCFLSLEGRFEKQSRLSTLYKAFMSEYELLGHMSECSSVNSNEQGHFIPHHGVLRESSSTTKLRAVFNASSPTSTGISYNDLQMVGPTVQDDLLSLLLRFRQHKYIIAADVEKMYRQVVVHPDFRHLQQIVWRHDSSQPIKTYQLNTVTYGTASAPFLATRCLKQIGLECSNEKVKEIIIHDFYVDDLLTGGDTLEEIIFIRDQVTAELASAGMPLRKWKSNHPEFASESSKSSIDLNIGASEPNKTLGLSWQTSRDELSFPIGIGSISGAEEHTKRDVLSVIAQIFDPLGLLSPFIISMKMLLQKLWLIKITWDESLPIDVSKTWIEILQSLFSLNEIRIPRYVLIDCHSWIEIHVFSDASEKAYGACLYLRSANHQGDVSVQLLMAKSRVAPIKPTTIPRLELCGALVGTRLYEKARQSLRMKIKSVTFWTDSTVVLGWLKMMPNKLQPFVRNRTAEIIDKTGDCVWRHVPTDQNPADFISRGLNADSLQSLKIWWSGPEFLIQEPSSWPSAVSAVSENLPETRPEISLNAVINKPGCDNEVIDFNRFSSFQKLKRTMAYVWRFVNACRKQKFNSVALSEEELTQGLNTIIKLSQKESFTEYDLLLNHKPLPRKSQLLKFNVFMDNNNIMRVGGRLSNSNFSYDKKHPVLIQSTHPVSKLIFEHEHRRLMHAAPQLLLYTVRETYWPIGGQRLAKACYRNCVRCVRMRGRTITPLMGNLPVDRLVPGQPFKNVGVDYAGPIMAASRQGRGCRLVKTYIVVFICFGVKAIHLELVSDLTSQNYLLALRRFISRRGKPLNIYSDNGTSFVGACNELSKFLKTGCDSLAEAAANDGMRFHFIPAYSPHFGGLWEAGVKSTKFHLNRVLGHCKLTYEELNSTLIQIEAILNSRPLTPMSNDPEDLTPLTPGHFLIGRPLTALPCQDYTDHSTPHLTRYQRIEQLRQHFWARWHKEYTSQLQHRVKWRENSQTLRTNTLVIIKEDNLPPLKWKLGRIVAAIPGADGICRVADVKTADGVVRRSFSRICPLPEDRASHARGDV